MRKSSVDYLEMYIDENQLIYKPQIQKLLNISRSTLGRRIKVGEFPPPSLIQSGRSCWIFKNIRGCLPNF